jgi:hypothetical protein
LFFGVAEIDVEATENLADEVIGPEANNEYQRLVVLLGGTRTN